MINKKIIIPKEILTLFALAIILNVGRVVIFHSTYLLYMLWNIFLAILPFIVSATMLWYATNKKLNNAVLIISGIFWILLFPNAPYMVTDLIHIGRGHTVPALYDILLLFSSAWLGLIIGMHSLSHIEQIVRMRWSKTMTSIIIIVIILLTSFGIYIGRFLRWNSWDIFTHPIIFFSNIANIFIHPFYHIDAYFFTGLFFVFIYMDYTAWKHSGGHDRAMCDIIRPL